MTMAGDRQRPSQRPSGRIDWPFLAMLCLASLLIVGLWSYPLFQDVYRRDLIYDSDSVLRLVEVRDLLNGQGWYDMRQSRLGFGEGTAWHWSRLADLGPAFLILLFGPFMGTAQAEHWMMITYPPLVFMPLILLLYWAARRVAALIKWPDGAEVRAPPRDWALVGILGVMIIQMDSVIFHFLPGLIDHHSLQMIGLVAFVGATLGPRSFGTGLIAAAGLNFGLVVGIDGLPFVIGGLCGLVLVWTLDPSAERGFLRGLGWGTLGLTAINLVIFMPRPLNTMWCDSWTLPLASGLFVMGLYVLALADLVANLKRPLTRLVVAALVGIAILFGLLVLFPACRDPSQLYDPLFQTYWMGQAEENLSPWMAVTQNPLAILPQLFGLLAIGFAFYLVVYKWLKLKEVLPALAVLGFGLVGNALYVRAGAMLSLSAIILFAPSILALLKTMKPGPKRASIWALTVPSAAIYAFTIVFMPVGKPLITNTSQESQSETWTEFEDSSVRLPIQAVHCFGPEQLKAVQALPPSRILAPLGQSEYLLHTTHHTLVYSGYHRLNHDLAWVMHWLLASPKEAAVRRSQRPFDYLSICPRNVQFRHFARDYPDSFIAGLMMGKVPDWLVPVVPLQSGGMIYRVQRELGSPSQAKVQ